mgnify:CR=1 FL=1
MLPVIILILGGVTAYQATAGRRQAYAAGVADAVATVEATHKGAQMAQRDAVILDPALEIAAVTDQSHGIRRVSARAMRELERRSTALPLFTAISGMGAAIPPDVVAQQIAEESPGVRWVQVLKRLRARNTEPDVIARVKSRFARASEDERRALLSALDDDDDQRTRRERKSAGGRKRSTEQLYVWILERLTVLEGRAATKRGLRSQQVQSRLATYREQAAAARQRDDRQTLVQIAAKLKGESSKKRKKRNKPLSRVKRLVRGAVGTVTKPARRLIRRRRRSLRGMMGLIMGPGFPSYIV